MKRSNQIPDEILLRYLDGDMPVAEQEMLERTLQYDQVLRSRLDALRKADGIMQQLTMEEPSRNFTSVVMRRLDEEPLRAGLSIRNGIFLFLGILLIMVIAVLLLSAGVFDQTTTLNPNDIGIINRYIKQTLPSFLVDGKMIMNAILILNMALLFVVLDRAILRPIFQRRLQL
jgi:hypothetical protein